MIKKLFIWAFLLVISFGIINPVLAADSNICCQKGTFLNPTDDMCYYPEDPDDPTGGDKLAGGPWTCPANQICDNSTNTPSCKAKFPKTENICCEKGFVYNDEDGKCYESDPLAAAQNPYTCTLPNQVCDNSSSPPQCWDQSIPASERKNPTKATGATAAVQKTPEEVFGTIPLPGAIANIPGLTGAAKLSSFLSTGIILLFLFGGTAFVFMIVFAAIRWITSGGDKEAVASARKRITWAIVGLILLSLAFLIIGLIGSITGISLFQGNELIPGQQFQEIERQRNIQKERERFEGVQRELSKDANLCTRTQIDDCDSVDKICVVEGGKVGCKTEREICKDSVDDCREAKRECYVENGKPVCKRYADICDRNAIEDCQSRRPAHACVNNNGQPRCVLVP